MAVFHVTLKFSTREHGWVEQFYRQDSSISAALRAGVELAAARYAILGTGVDIYQVRVAVPGMPRVAASSPVLGTTLPYPAMLAYEGAEIRLKSGGSPGRNRPYFLRGLPRGSLVNPEGPARWSAIVAAGVDRFLGMLTSGRWLMQVRGYQGPKYPVTGVYPLVIPGSNYDLPDGGPPGPSPWQSAVLVTTMGTPFVPLADTSTGAPPTVRLGLVRWSDLAAELEKPINGEWPIALGIPGGLQYIGSVPRNGQYAGGGYAQISLEGYAPIASATLMRQGTRHCGPISPGSIPPPGVASVPSAIPDVVGTIVNALANLPLAITQFRDSITPLIPSPPVIPSPAPPPPPPPFATLRTAGDVADFIYTHLTYSGEGENYTPIGIAQITNLENTWLVALSGLYSTEGSDTGLLAAVVEGLNHPTAYASRVSQHIDEVIPSDAKLVFAGFSLGGICAENVTFKFKYRRRTINVMTFGSPISGIQFPRAPIVRFKDVGDLVPMLTPLGAASTLLVDAGYIVVRLDPVNTRFPANHLNFPLNPDLHRWDCWGQREPTDNPPLVLGELQRFNVPVPP